MTLLKPSEGTIKVNQKLLDHKSRGISYSRYQNNISHIPQSIHLIDDNILTYKSNI